MRVLPVHAPLLALLLLPAAHEGQALAVQGARSDVASSPPPHEVLELSALPPRAEHSLIAVRIGGVERVLELRPHSLRSEGFQVLVPRDGRLLPVQVPAPRTVRGVVLGVPGSRVTGSIGERGLSVQLDLPGESVESWAIEPEAALVPRTARSQRHLVYRMSDVRVDEAFGCGVEGPSPRTHAPASPLVETALGGTLTTAEIACDADFEFFQQNGSSVAATVLDIEDVLNRVETIYEAQVGITYELTTVVVRDDLLTSPYLSVQALTLLNEFREEWNGNPDLGASVARDVAQLFTGKNLAANQVGYAWVGVMCNSPTTGMGYSVVESRFLPQMVLRACLSAHELGHNWSASHCNGDPDCAIMCGTINSCGSGCVTFGASASQEIAFHRDTRGCFEDQPAPLALPLVESFPASTLDPAVWSHIDGGEVAEDAPGASRALALDAAGAGPHQDDDVRTAELPLAGTSGVSTAWRAARSGVEAGEELVVEYRGDALAWVELERLVSDGIDPGAFSYHRHLLPADALHAEFRLRLRPEVDEPGDRWFVDDLVVGVLRDLDVTSTPVGGVSVTASPLDGAAAAGGTTPFSRVHLDGTTVVLTAPAGAGGLEFFGWRLDGQPQGPAEELQLVLGADATACAEYRAVHALQVTSAPWTGVPIAVTPPDRAGMAAGATPFVRSYFDGEQVALTAPFRSGDRFFRRWVVDGSPDPGAGRTVVISMSAAREARAEYTHLWRERYGVAHRP